jgi:hypothetical protein
VVFQNTALYWKKRRLSYSRAYIFSMERVLLSTDTGTHVNSRGEQSADSQIGKKTTLGMSSGDTLFSDKH